MNYAGFDNAFQDGAFQEDAFQEPRRRGVSSIAKLFAKQQAHAKLLMKEDEEILMFIKSFLCMRS